MDGYESQHAAFRIHAKHKDELSIEYAHSARVARAKNLHVKPQTVSPNRLREQAPLDGARSHLADCGVSPTRAFPRSRSCMS